jgi:predicted dienelactone hydrolase
MSRLETISSEPWRARALAARGSVEGMAQSAGAVGVQFASIAYLRAGLLFAALLVAGLFWAKLRDPWARERLTLDLANGQRAEALAVMPDRGGPFPVVLFSPGAGSSVLSSGEALRWIASQGHKLGE